ncbi:hypothetical protein L1049_018075 [Liquidambar formosana]|uniref:Uncharacterized protein n=1 Tax=Liquidambar formosana TaxID=63359 RepID=A0AAP0R9L1_LIQFO
MAWRELGKKGIRASITDALNSTLLRGAVVSNSASTFEDAVKSISTSVRCMPDFFVNSALQGAYNCKVLTKQPLIRCFHTSPELLARRRNDEPVGLKTSKEGEVCEEGEEDPTAC